MTSTEHRPRTPRTVVATRTDPWPGATAYEPRHARPADEPPAPPPTEPPADDERTDGAHRLPDLDPEWRAVPAIPLGKSGAAIDLLVIGPGGVFTIDTKDHPDASVWVCGDTFKVDRKNQHYVRNSRSEAQRAAKLLSERALFDVEVRGIIAVLGAHGGFTVKEQPADVTVLISGMVAAHLRSLPVVLGPASIARIHHGARELATWRPKTVEWADF